MSIKNLNLENAPEELRNAVKKLNEMGVELTVIRDYLTRKYTIEFMHVDLMEPIRFDKLVTFDRKLCTEIIDRGLDIDGQALTDAMNIILKHKALLIEHHTHSIIGFYKGRYYHNDIYELNPDDPKHPVKVIPSEYTGSIGARDSYGNRINPLAPKGDLQTNIAGLRELVIPYTGLVLGMAAGASGLILQHLDNLDTNITLTFYGKTSHGKSTCEHLILSLFGHPKYLKENFNATQNYHIESMAARGPLPYVIDEIKLGFDESKDAIDFLFKIAAGRSRSTLKTESQEFCCPGIFSSEVSLLSVMDDGETEGQLYRMNEQRVDGKTPETTLTLNAEHAENIEALILENYGLIIPYVEQYMLEHGIDAPYIRSLCQMLKQHMLDTYKELTGDERIALRMAIILASAKILDDACNFGIDHKALEKLLVKNFKDSKKTMKQEMPIYTYIKEQCFDHYTMIGTYDNYDENCHVGVIRCDTKYSSKFVCFTPDRMRLLLSEYTFEEILEETKERAKAQDADTADTANPFAYVKKKTPNKKDIISDAKFKSILRKLRDNGYIHANTQSGFTKYIDLYPNTGCKKQFGVICIELR